MASKSSLRGLGLIARHVKVALEAAAGEREAQKRCDRAEKEGFFNHDNDEKGKNGRNIVSGYCR